MYQKMSEGRNSMKKQKTIWEIFMIFLKSLFIRRCCAADAIDDHGVISDKKN